MWRAIAMSIGICLVILGGEAMVVDKVVLADTPAANSVSQVYDRTADSPYLTDYDDLTSYGVPAPTQVAGRVISPPEWAPWGLLSAGVLTFLYASGLPLGGE